MAFHKSLLALLFLSLISYASSATACGPNPLLAAFGITSISGNAQVVSGIQYCKSLKNKEICCSAETINGFQAKSDALIKRLTDSVAKRDQSLIDVRKNTIPNLSGQLSAMKDASNRAAVKLAESAAIVNDPNALLNNPTGAANAIMNVAVSGMVQAYGLMATQLTDSLATLKTGFTDYQAQRSACIVDIVKIQAAAWCLACDTDFGTKGATSDGIAFSSNLEQTLTDSCFKYFSGAAAQSAIFSINLIGSNLADMNSAMNNIANGDATGATQFMTAMVMGMANGAANIAADPSRLPAELPSDCTADNCQWIADTLFKGGAIDETSLSMGGKAGSTTPSFPGIGGKRLLEGSPRVLAAGSWDPDVDEAGVTVAFATNPGNVDNNSAFLMKGVMGGLLVLLTVLFV